MEIGAFPWGSQRGKGVERKIFSYGSFTLISFNNSVVYPEAECLASWWARVQFWAREKGAGNGMRSRKTLLFPSVWSEAKETNLSWTDSHVVNLQRKRKGKRRDMSKCFSSCWKKKAKVAVRIHSPCLTDGKTKVEMKAPFLWTKMARYKLLITTWGLSKPSVSKEEQETKAKPQLLEQNHWPPCPPSPSSAEGSVTTAGLGLSHSLNSALYCILFILVFFSGLRTWDRKVVSLRALPQPRVASGSLLHFLSWVWGKKRGQPVIWEPPQLEINSGLLLEVKSWPELSQVTFQITELVLVFWRSVAGLEIYVCVMGI